MKVVIESFHSPYTGEHVGGAETSLRLIAEELTGQGHDVAFLSRSHTQTIKGFRKKKINGVTVIVFTKFKIKFLNSYFLKSVFRSFREKYIEGILSGVDIVHTYNNMDIISFYSRVKSKFSYKLVVRMAGLKTFEDLKIDPSLKPLYEHNLRQVDLFNFISNGLRVMVSDYSSLYDLNVDFEPFFTGDIGINLSGLPEKKYAPQIKDSKFRIVMASRLSKYQKRQDLLIEAMSYLKDENIELTLIGDGPNLKPLKAKVIDNNLTKKVIFMSFQNNIWDTLKEYDLLVHACNYEGLSKIIIESMGIGLPVLASNVLPLKNYIEDGSNGFLVDNNAHVWAEKIISVKKQRNDLKSISENSRDYIKTNYDSKRNIENYEHAFHQLL